jgi:uncharacterized membrane protein YdjX (TVP38/TMEM64 family)
VPSDLPPAARPRSLLYARIALVLAAFGLLATAHQLGWLARLGDPARLVQTLVDLGAWGYVAYVLAFAIFQPFGIPGTVFVVAAPLIWPWPIAFALSMTGAMAASVIGFSFTRFVVRDGFSSRIPARFRKYEDALARRAFLTVFLLRLVFWMPQVLHAFFGVSKVRFSTHFWGSLAGYVLPLLLMSFFGQRIFDAARAAPASLWVGLGAGALVIAATVLIARRHRAASA